MSMTWLANADKATFWAHQTWADFAALPDKEKYSVILPLFALADHGLGLPLDAEETAGSALLRAAVEQAKAVLPLRVLPPLRFGLAPYPSCFFGIDSETAHELIREIASSVLAAGFKKLVFFNTSPWNEEFIDVASRDTRVSLGLQTFVINLSGLDLDFHPSNTARNRIQSIVAHLLGQPPETVSRPGEISDVNFRPGVYRQPNPIAFDAKLDGSALVSQASTRPAVLLAEIHARPTLG